MNCVLYGQIQNVPPKTKQKQTNDKGQVFIKESGWLIPKSKLSKTESYTFKVKLKENRKIKVKVTYFDFLDTIITNEPFASIGKDASQIQYREISEYKVKDQIFCYKIQFSLVPQGIAVLSFFSYYDEDGDGKFESLVLDETVDGRSSFFNVPHIPKWVLKKKGSVSNIMILKIFGNMFFLIINCETPPKKGIQLIATRY